jgi:hypothetical protein
MKNFYQYLLALILTGTAASGVSAANLDGHMQYRIVSYSFNSDDISDSGSADLGPLLITGLTSDILTDPVGSSGYGITNPKNATDIFAVSADFSATPDLSLHGAFGVTKNRWSASLDPDYNGSWEANLGVIYQLFNNIRYEIHFGYMETGDLFKERNTYTDEESIIMISNKLTMSF